MKVIVAGYPKTGTKSMVVALQQLGYNVYDFMEQYLYHGKDWDKILTEGGTTEDFHRMYENVDVVTDVPAAYFWDEIHAAFPDAKIILTVRDNEDVWFNSVIGQMRAGNTTPLILLQFLSPTYRHLRRHAIKVALPVFGVSMPNIELGSPKSNKIMMTMAYRRHNAHVLQNAPKDKLLVYSVKQGWEPLCKFLDKPVPLKPFPHKNVRGNVVEELFAKHPFFQRVKKEAGISCIAIAALVIYGGYKLSKNSRPSAWINCWTISAKNLVSRIISLPLWH